ncbi:MAG: shikimate kinase [Pirellulales bacterium]
MNVYLIGYRGTGKTSVARLLATRLGWQCQDADTWLESREGRTIAEIFASQGEAVFRDLEAEVLQELIQRDHHVISLGGGVVLRAANREALRGGRTVWLTASPATLAQRIAIDPTTGQRRPNLTSQGGLAEIEQLLQMREPLYRQCAQLIVDTEQQTPDEVAARIADWLAGEGAAWTSG